MNINTLRREFFSEFRDTFEVNNFSKRLTHAQARELEAMIDIAEIRIIEFLEKIEKAGK